MILVLLSKAQARVAASPQSCCCSAPRQSRLCFSRWHGLTGCGMCNKHVHKHIHKQKFIHIHTHIHTCVHTYIYIYHICTHQQECLLCQEGCQNQAAITSKPLACCPLGQSTFGSPRVPSCACLSASLPLCKAIRTMSSLDKSSYTALRLCNTNYVNLYATLQDRYVVHIIEPPTKESSLPKLLAMPAFSRCLSPGTAGGD